MGQTRKDFIQPSELHSELLLRHCSYYSDTRGVTLEPFFLFSCALPFIFGAVGFLPHRILRQSDPPPSPQVAVHTSKTL
jgi:hypothetical protein